MTEKEKIELIMEKEKLNSFQFASAIGIPSSTVSHILNDRNKPSLDVLKKILAHFKNISSDWLIMDKEPMYLSVSHSQEPSLFDFSEEIPSKTVSSAIKSPEKNELNFEPIQKKITLEPEIFATPVPEAPKTPVPTPISIPIPILSPETPPRSIRKIIVYYSDNTFQEFES